jgi:hypothetical protein
MHCATNHTNYKQHARLALAFRLLRSRGFTAKRHRPSSELTGADAFTEATHERRFKERCDARLYVSFGMNKRAAHALAEALRDAHVLYQWNGTLNHAFVVLPDEDYLCNNCSRYPDDCYCDEP